MILWDIKKVVKKGDYLYAVVPEHPNRTKNNYVLLHRVVKENEIGRLLEKHEVVHHKNHDKKDNSPDNLEIKTSSEHAKEHAKLKGRKFVRLKCPECRVVFERRHGRTHLVNGRNTYKATFCSKKCSGKFSTRIQKTGITEELEICIKENVILEYRKF